MTVCPDQPQPPATTVAPPGQPLHRGWRRLARTMTQALWARRDGVLVVLVLLVLGVCISLYKVGLVHGRRHIGHADEAAYVHMARSLAQGRGLTVDYVSWFFVPYDRGISRREDHWPPFVSLVAVPFVWMLGDQPWVYRLAPILIVTVLLPLAAAALGMAYSRRGYVGLGAGLLMLGNVALFADSLQVLSDTSLALLVTGYLAALLGSVRRPWLHLVAGALAALAYYAKGSQLVLIALYPVAVTLLAGLGVWRRRWPWLGLGTAAVVAAPLLWGTYRAYGHPLHNTQNYVSGYMGLLGWEEGTYPAYWGQNLPRTSDRWTKFGPRYWQLVMHNRQTLTRCALLGPGTRARDWRSLGTPGIRLELWLSQRKPKKRESTEGETAPLEEWHDPRTAVCGLTGTAFAALVLVGGLVSAAVGGGRWLWKRWRPARRGAERTAKPAPAQPASPWPGLVRPTLVLVLVCAVEWTFVVYLWEAMGRFSYVFMPVTAVTACTAVSRVLELPFVLVWPRQLLRWQWLLGLVLGCAAIGALVAWRGPLIEYQRANARLQAYPYVEQPFYPDLGNWFAQNLPGAVVMTRNPWELLYHCSPSNKAVNVPLAPAPTVFAIARYYRATHYVADGRRPALEPYVKGTLPGLKSVAGAPGPVFEFQYDLLPGGTATVSSLPPPGP